MLDRRSETLRAWPMALWLMLLALSAPPANANSARIDPKSIVTMTGTVERHADGTGSINVQAKIRHGFHVNAHKPSQKWLIPTVLTLESAGTKFSEITYPAPFAAEFEFAPDMTLLVYEGTLALTADAEPAPHGPVVAKLRYQACDDTNCLRPVTIETTFGTAEVAATSDGPGLAGSFSDPGWLESFLTGASLPARLGMVLLLGLGLNLTPCVYPLISVTLSYFGAQGTRGDPASAPAQGSTSTLPLAVAYVLGITLSFAVLGTTAALAGGLFGAPLQHPAVLIGLALLLLGLAGSSFGLYEIRAPWGLVNRVGAARTGFGGALLMGLTMGIVAAPCIGPVVLGLLVYVGTEKDAVLGFLLFATMGLGMGLPYIALASAAGSIAKLPRSGEWLRWTNRVFGVILVGMAYYFLTPLIPTELEQILLPLIVAGGSVYLGFLEPSGAALRGFRVLKRGVGVAGLGFGIWLALPGEPMAAGIRWQPLSPSSLSRAIEEGKPAVVEFGAEWCLPCVEMEHSTFIDPAVTHQARSFSMLQADVTEDSAANDALLEEFGVAGVPTIIFYDRDGAERERLVGFVSARRMLDSMQRVREVGRAHPHEPDSEPAPAPNPAPGLVPAGADTQAPEPPALTAP